MKTLTAIAALMLLTAQPVAWQGKTRDGKDIAVPSQKITLALFLRPGQKHSLAAQRFAEKLKADDVDIVAFVSGPDAAVRAGDMQSPFPLVVDPMFEASGAMDVHVWPTTLIIKPTGEITAHVASLPSSYLKDVEAHLAFARGAIDAAERDKRLAANDVVADSPSQVAERHVRIARQMLERGRTTLARAELDKALAAAGDDPSIKLALADLLSSLGEPAEALTQLEAAPAGAAPPWQTALIRGRALVRLDRHAEAEQPLTQAVSLNPRPSEAWYLLGLVHEKEGDIPNAAAAYRKAYETTQEGRTHKAP